MTSAIGRRAFVRASGAFGVLALLPDCGNGGSTDGGRFLDRHELETLRAVTARLIPGPPEDPDPGAVEAGAAEAIDRLLGAFTFRVPPIHAGGPFSDRAGATHDDFASFVPLDAYTELGWRIRIEGSRGLPERELAGPVVGLQEVYRAGLARLDVRARERAGVAFVALPSTEQDALLGDRGDDALQEFVGTALMNTLEATYGPPEYGGNRDGVGWLAARWDGDVEPRGYDDAEVSEPSGVTTTLDAASAAALVERFLGALAASRLRHAGAIPSRRSSRVAR